MKTKGKLDFKIGNLFVPRNNIGDGQIFIILAIATWIGYYWYCGEFGLYEDDYTLVSYPMNMDHGSLWWLIKDTVSKFYQGRPVGFTLLSLFSFLGAKIAGITGIYWIGFLINTINGFLFYLLLKRLFNNSTFTVTGGLAFCLFPADTTHAFLTHIHVYPGLTFLLIAFHCYLSGKIKLSYLVILGALLSYETIFPVFLAAPLLQEKWNKKLFQELIKHTIILALLLLITLIIRKFTGESRVTELNTISALMTSVRQMFLGPLVSLSMFLYRPFQTLQSLKGEKFIFVIFSFLGLTWTLFNLKKENNPQNSREKLVFWPHIRQLALTGLIMLILAYPLTLTVPATEIAGRNSRVHTAAVVGASILVACFCFLMISFASKYRQKNLATGILAAFLALLIGFGLHVQHDYRFSWQLQRQFWTDIVNLCPDMEEETLILVKAPNLLWPSQISPFSIQSDPYILMQMYEFPSDWKFPPKLYRIDSKWEQNILSYSQFKLNFLEWETERIVDLSDIILLEEQNSKLIRRNTPLIIKGKKLVFKQISDSNISSFKKKQLSNYLIKSLSETKVKYIN